MIVVTMTTPVEPTTLFLSGQLTFPNSVWTSVINCLVFSKKFIVFLKPFYELILAYGNLAGQEGLEPPTPGFGDRRSTNWSYWPTFKKR